jgi:predicted transcriptional regulator
MSKTSVITARIDEGTLQLVDRIVSAQGRTRAWFIARAVQRYAEAEGEYLVFVQEGIDALDRGEVVPHDEVMAELDRLIMTQEARCVK